MLDSAHGMIADEFHPLALLACGDDSAGGDLQQVLQFIGKTLSTIVRRTERLLDTSDPDDVVLFGPFLGRSMLELSMTALIARFDPFRVLVLRMQQMASDYSLGKRNSAAIQWSGDVLAKEKESKPQDSNQPPDKMTRALFGAPCDHVHWQSALPLALDRIEASRGGAWMQDLRRIAPESFVPGYRAQLSKLFSTCSKGVHHEFVIAPGSYYEPDEVSTLCQDVRRAVAQICLVANFSTNILQPLPDDKAVTAFEALQSLDEEMP